MNNQTRIISILSDGAFHSGEELGKTLGISRTGIWMAIKKLSTYGLDLHSVRGKGYRFAHAVELLDSTKILRSIEASTRNKISNLDVFLQLESTNAYLMGKVNSDIDKANVCFAEMQTAGRGRRGRKWISPFGGNIYMSILRHFSSDPQMLGGLGLALSVAIIRTLQDFGINDVKLKWPNDVIWQKRKLAGTLVEMVAESTGPCRVVMGIGFNADLSNSVSHQIDQPWVDLKTILGEVPSRNQLAGKLLQQLFNAITQFEQSGLSMFAEEWRRYDAYSGNHVSLLLPKDKISGICEGIDNMGALLVRVADGQIQKFTSGEISLRG
ncbi:MAG: bifunctional biotin--[acetyl-CoA-carboxylase] ligase/biotin operon repressor BirA [Gammaproteobacteria bacterium]|nr:bifunctional biotin--[acetyl-CoA-carboxylase] ligase/biotin operon repressor BirA [Gammaproteobacteria bacterium]